MPPGRTTLRWQVETSKGTTLYLHDMQDFRRDERGVDAWVADSGKPDRACVEVGMARQE